LTRWFQQAPLDHDQFRCRPGLGYLFATYEARESFRDMKNLLGLEKLMNKHRDNMEKMVALLLIAYASVFGWEKRCAQHCSLKVLANTNSIPVYLYS